MVALSGLLDGQAQHAPQEMRVQVGPKVRYPDVRVFTGRFDPTIRTLTDAVVIFEVLSDDTAVTDRADKLLEYATLPLLRGYVLLEQTAMAATLFRRDPGGEWIASAHTGAIMALPGLDIGLSLPDLYRGLMFAA